MAGARGASLPRLRVRRTLARRRRRIRVPGNRLDRTEAGPRSGRRWPRRRRRRNWRSGAPPRSRPCTSPRPAPARRRSKNRMRYSKGAPCAVPRLLIRADCAMRTDSYILVLQARIDTSTCVEEDRGPPRRRDVGGARRAPAEQGRVGRAVGSRRVTRMDRLQTHFEESLSEARAVRCATGRTGEPAPLTNREPRAESREPRAESREPRAESREPRAESREPRAESREPRAESREPRAESREPRAESREPRAESRHSTPGLHRAPAEPLPGATPG